MIYFMVAFFLALNNANWIWWGGFLTICLAEMFIGFVKYNNKY